MKKWKRWLLVFCIIGVIGYVYWKFAIPTHRIEIYSKLVMLGDLDNDNRWTAGNLKLLDAFLDGPFADSSDAAWRLDLNRNGLIDKEDLVIIRKSTARNEDFRTLVKYAQHDPRYLAAVSRTNPKHHDPRVENHNLPMVLLFREALRIKQGDKKKAVGLLDEAIRIPYGWIKSIPRKALPDSVALENFLLPGNKEDGADKSRHWNVFGGLCLYKSPQEAIDLALKREIQDLRIEKYTTEAMREFLRDMIANLNGMNHVMALNPDLLYVKKQ